MHNNTSTCTTHKSTEDVDGLENYFMAKSQRKKIGLGVFRGCLSQPARLGPSLASSDWRRFDKYVLHTIHV